MKPLRVAVATCLSLTLLSAPLSANPQKEAAAAKKESASGADFKALLMKIADAWQSMDVERVAPYYAKDADLAFFDFMPLKYTGWAEYAAGFAGIVNEFEAMSVKLSDIRTRQSGNAAWATAVFHGSFTKKDGSVESMEGRGTLIWEKRGKDWLVVHDHWSVPLPAPEGGE